MDHRESDVIANSRGIECFSWTNISYVRSVSSTESVITDVSGTAKAGELSVIMGPS
jgi:hypothetical protein